MSNHFAKQSKPDGQHGAALLIVILLIATLSFVALGIAERTSLAAAQSTNARARGEALWLAFGAERLAVKALSDIVSNSGGVLARDAPWANEPSYIPLDGGGVRLFFVDNTGCFNVNALAEASSDTFDKSESQKEFERLVQHYGLGDVDGERIASLIRDWVDADDLRQPLGAEDASYTQKPSPYRTAGGPIAATSEIRAMDGVTRDIYASLKPLVCALPNEKPTSINVNMVTPEDAPLLAAVLGDGVSPLQARDLIAARPPGGFTTIEAFISDEKAEDLGLTELPPDRFALTSNYMLARAEIVYNEAVIEMTMSFSVGADGEVNLLSRRLGADE